MKLRRSLPGRVRSARWKPARGARPRARPLQTLPPPGGRQPTASRPKSSFPGFAGRARRSCGLGAASPRGLGIGVPLGGGSASLRSSAGGLGGKPSAGSEASGRRVPGPPADTGLGHEPVWRVKSAGEGPGEPKKALQKPVGSKAERRRLESVCAKLLAPSAV